MLLNINGFVEKNDLKYVTTANVTIGEKYDPNGVYSNDIFGLEGSTKWRNTFAAINLYSKCIHPIVYEILLRTGKMILKLFDGEISINQIGKNDYIVLDGDGGSWGVPYFINNCDGCCKALIETGKLSDNCVSLLKYIMRNQDKVFIDHMIVIPPAYRPAMSKYDRIQIHEISERYVSIITEANILKITAPGSGVHNRIVFKLTEHIYNLYRDIQQVIKGKHGLQRTSLLGKTLDFSGRAVITGDKYIDPDHIGIPFKMAVVIFAPFIIYESTHEYASRWNDLGIKPTMMYINKVIKYAKESSKDLTPPMESLLKEILNKIVKGKVVLAKRDPSLHRLSMRAFYPVIVDDSSIHISPMVTAGFNADDNRHIIVRLAGDGK